MGSRQSRREALLSGPRLAEESSEPGPPALPTSATDVLLVAFAALTLEQQEQVFAELHERRLEQIAGDETEMAKHLRSLRRVAAYVGEELTPSNYRAARAELVAQEEQIYELNTVIRFYGSWRQAKRALSLSAATTPFAVENRLFRARRVGKVHRYTEASLREAITACAAEVGPPLQVVYELWRQQTMEVSRKKGKPVYLPSDSPFRRRYGSWEAALVALLDYDLSEIKARLEPGRARSTEAARSRHPQESHALAETD